MQRYRMMRLIHPRSGTIFLLNVFLISLIVGISVILYLRSLDNDEERPTSNMLIAGSSTLNILYIQPLAEEFMKFNRDVVVVSAGGGSTAGLIAVKKGAIDIGGMSRDLVGNEDDESVRSYLIGRDSIAIVLNGENKINDLTLDHLRDLFEGKIENWKELGGADATVTVCVREEGSTTRLGFEEMVMRGADYSTNSKEFNSHKTLYDGITKDKGAIGYYRGFWLGSELGKKVKAVTIDGVEMSKMTMLSGRYPLTRSLYLVFNGEPKGNAKRFFDYVCSGIGQDLLEKRGAIPVYAE